MEKPVRGRLVTPRDDELRNARRILERNDRSEARPDRALCVSGGRSPGGEAGARRKIPVSVEGGGHAWPRDSRMR